jgi:hypothetical protein
MRDLTGQQVGQRLILKYLGYISGNGTYRTLCICGKDKDVHGYELRRNLSQQCQSCTKRKKVYRRWHGKVYVKGSPGVSARGEVLANRFCEQCGQETIGTYANITQPHAKTCGCRYKIAKNPITLVMLLAEGKSKKAIAREIGVSDTAVRSFLKYHPEILALPASLGEEELISEALFPLFAESIPTPSAS